LYRSKDSNEKFPQYKKKNVLQAHTFTMNYIKKKKECNTLYPMNICRHKQKSLSYGALRQTANAQGETAKA
jgi:hypothetical protein